MNPYLLVAILFSPSIIVLFLGWIAFDKLIDFQYTKDRESWIADGEPTGMFWGVSETKLFQGVDSRNRIMFRLIFRTPSWAKQSPEALKLVKRYRFCGIYWIASLLICFGLLQYLTRGS